MKRRTILFFALALFALASTSCRNYEKLDFVDAKVSSLKFLGSSRLDLGIEVIIDNPTSSSYSVTDMSGVFYKDGGEFADVVLKDKVTVSPKKMNVIEVPLNVELVDPVGFLNGMDLDTFKGEGFTVSIDMRVKNGLGLSKRLVYDRIPVKNLAGSLGKGRNETDKEGN